MPPLDDALASNEKAEKWLQELGQAVAQCLGWPCNLEQLDCVCLPPRAAMAAVKQDFAQSLNLSVHDVSGFGPRERAMSRRLRAALLPQSSAVVVVAEGKREHEDEVRGAMFRQLVRHAQRQRFPQFFAELDRMLAQTHTFKRPLSEDQHRLCARALDRLLWAEGHAEYAAALARPKLFPREGEGEAAAAGIWGWIRAWLNKLLESPSDDLGRAVRAFDKIAQGQPGLVDRGFREPLVAEILTHGQRPYVMVLPYGQAERYRGEMIELGPYRLFYRDLPEREGPPPEPLLDPRGDALAAGRQLIRLGKERQGFEILLHAGVANKDTACLLELGHASRFALGGQAYFARAYEALAKLAPDQPEARQFMARREEAIQKNSTPGRIAPGVLPLRA